jgi:hypothetical protein
MVTVVSALLQEFSTPNNKSPLLFDRECGVLETNTRFDQDFLNDR